MKVPFDQFHASSAIRVRVSPIDVGFDLRLHGMTVEISADTTAASYEDRGKRWVVTGSADDIVEALTRAGYKTRLTPAAQ